MCLRGQSEGEKRKAHSSPPKSPTPFHSSPLQADFSGLSLDSPDEWSPDSAFSRRKPQRPGEAVHPHRGLLDHEEPHRRRAGGEERALAARPYSPGPPGPPGPSSAVFWMVHFVFGWLLTETEGKLLFFWLEGGGFVRPPFLGGCSWRPQGNTGHIFRGVRLEWDTERGSSKHHGPAPQATREVWAVPGWTKLINTTPWVSPGDDYK